MAVPIIKKPGVKKTSEVDEELRKLLETKRPNIRVVGAGGAGAGRARVRVRLVRVPLACHRRLPVDHHPGAHLRAARTRSAPGARAPCRPGALASRTRASRHAYARTRSRPAVAAFSSMT